MRLLVTADLHYDSLRSRAPAQEMARRICRAGGDALVLVGDSAGRAPQPLRDCLRMFAGFTGRRFLVMGNHCLWCNNGEDSIARYEQIVPDLAAEEGFEPLDRAPAVMGEVGLAGSVGWYDYSYRQQDLGIPLEFYRAKVAPGAAVGLSQHRHLMEAYGDELTPAQLDIGTRWMDGVYARLNMSDEQFLDLVLARLGGHLATLTADPAVKRVIAFTHHLPTREMVPYGRPAPIAFAAAYMGSDRIGQTLLACPKLARVYCGHSHWPITVQLGHVTAVNVGSTYLEKRLEVLELNEIDGLQLTIDN